MKPLVSIITVNYGQTEATQQWLDCCRALSYESLEIIVVDNASPDDPLPQLSPLYPEVQFIRSPRNLGFAGGNNLGITQARGAFLLFLNNDTLFPSDLIDHLLEAFVLHPDWGLLSPKIHYQEPPGTLQYAGYTAIHPLTGRNRAIGKGEVDQGQYDQASPTAYAHGAAMMIRREVLEAVGMMPEIYFLYYEEIEWSEKVREAGFGIGYTPRTQVYHQASLSVGRDSLLWAYYYPRNRILFMRRNRKAWEFGGFMGYHWLIVVPKTVLQLCWGRKWKHLRAFWRGVSGKGPC